jgi:hypothetical protein
MTILFSILGTLLILIIGSRVYQSVKFNNQVKELFEQKHSVSEKSYHLSMLECLPEAVQRYFNYTLKSGEPLISFMRAKHDGQFKTAIEKPWINIIGEQYATTQKPGFIWKGTTSIFTAKDLYISDKGRLTVTLLSAYNIMDASGDQYNQGELLRWLGESVLYPTNFLPSERLTWVEVDENRAKLSFTYKGLELFFIVTFNTIGEITELETKRYMDETKLETWVIQLSNYKELNNVKIPTSFEVLWRLEKGDFSYAKFNITEIEYDKAEQY